MQPTATIILDSIYDGKRVTTVVGKLWRVLLAELNTHRGLSKNSASSRAIPLRQTIAAIAGDPWGPMVWTAEHKGMSGTDDLKPEVVERAQALWIAAASVMSEVAGQLGQLGVHKSIANRLLEPFNSHTVLFTGDAAAFEHLFRLRCSPLAMPEFRIFAEAVRDAYRASTPMDHTGDPGFWHLPLVSGVDAEALIDLYQEDHLHKMKLISAARCARVSYLTHDGVRDPEKDLQLADRLAHPDSSGAVHASPFEHVCTPSLPGVRDLGNLTGWRQFRHEVEGLAA